MENKETWIIEVVMKNNGSGTKDKVLLSAGAENGNIVCLRVRGETLLWEITTDYSTVPLVLEAREREKIRKMELIYRGYRIELWADGKLQDEEWPCGVCLGKKAPEITYDRQEIETAIWREGAPVKDESGFSITNIRYWAPDLGRHNVGDCMPFADGDTWHLFYLKDRHQHKSKWGKGAHQFAHISTKDFYRWEEHPAAVEITHPWEGSICTGSIIRVKDRYYAYYAVRMMDGTGARISWAVSDDCIHFVKSEKYFSLTEPYESVSARDPEVFLGEDGVYHMLVTTDWIDNAVPQRSGCLAHLVSSDLEHWEQKEPFLVPGYTDQPECSDYFEWNGWYYLIFSNYGTAKYRYSRFPFGPFLCPDNEMIDGLLFRVPKTAKFHERRIAAGFLCINTEGESYAGSLVLRELVQRQDGTLGTRLLPELLPDTDGREKECLVLRSSETESYCQQEISPFGTYRKIRIKPEKQTGAFGICVGTQGGQMYEIRMEPEKQKIGIYPQHSNLYYYPTKRILYGIRPKNGEYELEVIAERDILDLCVNQERTLVCRMEEKWAGSLKWECFVKDNAAVFETE